MSDESVASSATPTTAASSSTSGASAAPASVATPDPGSGSAAPATPASSEEFGPVPYARFKEVNDRAKSAAEWREKYAWAESFQNTPYEFVENWMDQLGNHAEYGPKLLAKAARMLQARRGQGAPEPQAVGEEPQADIPVLDATGNVVNQTYSASQLRKWREWNAAQEQAQLQQRLAPLEAMSASFQQAQHQAQLEQQATAEATHTLTALRQDPYFTQHEPAIKAALVAHPEWGDNIDRAYRHVLTTDVIPSLKQTEQTSVLAQMKTQAVAGTVAPNGVTAGQKPSFRNKDGSPNFGKAAAYYAAHPDEAAALNDR